MPWFCASLALWSAKRCWVIWCVFWTVPIAWFSWCPLWVLPKFTLFLLYREFCRIFSPKYGLDNIRKSKGVPSKVNWMEFNACWEWFSWLCTCWNLLHQGELSFTKKTSVSHLILLDPHLSILYLTTIGYYHLWTASVCHTYCMLVSLP